MGSLPIPPPPCACPSSKLWSEKDELKEKEKTLGKLFPGISPRNEWWIEPGNNFKSHFLCSCEVVRLLCETLWALEWMKMAQNTPKFYHWFKVIDGRSCLIVLYCPTIHHSKQTLHSIVQYTSTLTLAKELRIYFFSQRAVGCGLGGGREHAASYYETAK